MNFLEQLSLLKRLDALIRRKATGTPDQLASRLGVSKSSVFRNIRILKSLGAPVVYCSCRDCYTYKEEFSLKIL